MVLAHDLGGTDVGALAGALERGDLDGLAAHLEGGHQLIRLAVGELEGLRRGGVAADCDALLVGRVVDGALEGELQVLLELVLERHEDTRVAALGAGGDEALARLGLGTLVAALLRLRRRGCGEGHGRQSREAESSCCRNGCGKASCAHAQSP